MKVECGLRPVGAIGGLRPGGKAEFGRKGEFGIGNAEFGNYRSTTDLIRPLNPEFQNLKYSIFDLQF